MEEVLKKKYEGNVIVHDNMYIYVHDVIDCQPLDEKRLEISYHGIRIFSNGSLFTVKYCMDYNGSVYLTDISDKKDEIITRDEFLPILSRASDRIMEIPFDYNKYIYEQVLDYSLKNFTSVPDYLISELQKLPINNFKYTIKKLIDFYRNN